MINEYYYLHTSHDEIFGSAYTEGVDRSLLHSEITITNWDTVKFWLKDGIYADHQMNNLGWRLCSMKLFGIIEKYRSPIDSIQCRDVEIIDEGREERPYYIWHIPEPPDVLDKNRTLFSEGDVVVKTCLDLKLSSEHHAFTFQGGIYRRIVSIKLRDAILAARCTGIEVSKVPTYGSQV